MVIIENQESVYRHEIKYFINKKQAAELKLFLRSYMNLDSNINNTGSYWIRSLYFDTIDNKDYYEKIIGHNNRKKIRLRIYNTSTKVVKLEIKNKYNNYILKETTTISREDANKLICGDCNSLLNYDQNVTNKVFALMHSNLYRPTVIIDYEREAYLYDFHNIRITIDKNLRSYFNPYDLFEKDICMIPVINDDVFILEVKYDHIIPIFLQKVLSNFMLQRSQISKYCMGRNILGK